MTTPDSGVVTVSPPPFLAPTASPLLLTPATSGQVDTTTSVIQGGIANQPSFITVLPTAPTNIPGPLKSSTSTSSSTLTSTLATATSIDSQPASSQASTLDSSQNAQAETPSPGVPMALVIGIATALAVLVVGVALVWWFCLKKWRRRNRDKAKYSEDTGTTFSGNDWQPQMTSTWEIAVGKPLDPQFRTVRNNRLSWQATPPSSTRSPTNVSPHRSSSDLESNLPEPLSPREVVQQTMQRVAVPRPVDASTLRPRSPPKASALSAIRKFVSKGPAPGMESGTTLGTRPSDTTLTRQYTVRKGPLAQNPFTDPADEDWVLQQQAEAHVSDMRPSLRIMNPDISRISLGERTSELVDSDQAQDDGQGPGQEHAEGSMHVATDSEANLLRQNPSPETTASTLPSITSTTTDEASKSSSTASTTPDEDSLIPKAKRVSFASNS